MDAPYRDGLSSDDGAANVSTLRASIPNAELLVWDAEQALRALQGHHVDSGDLWTLRRLLNTLETVQ